MPKTWKQKPKKKIRFVICKVCGAGIDEFGCSYECEYDNKNFDDRDPATMETLVYMLDRVEPYTPS